MQHWLTNILVLTLWLDCKGEDRVIQTREDVIITEGHTVSLRCNFETTDTNAYLFWYKQDINDFPRFSHALRMEEDLMLQSSTKTDLMPKSKTSVPLRIQNLQLSDSALYYCGLKPTVTGNTDSLYKNLLSTKHTSLSPETRRQTLLTKHINSSQHDCEGDSYQQTVHSIQYRVQALQGDKVTLSCNYSSANSFFWYLQYPSSHPQLLIKEYTELSGFTLKKDKEMFHLEISSAVVTDSALYYCAVRPTVTGNTDSLYKNLTAVQSHHEISAMEMNHF
ncbi:T cell receptor alpha variable 3 [Merluccius polli]|nr:T cell receptor alpha variable 3 [Merluccius polli]